MRPLLWAGRLYSNSPSGVFRCLDTYSDMLEESDDTTEVDRQMYNKVREAYFKIFDTVPEQCR